MSEHAKLSPSSSDRWLACPGSLVRAPETEDEGSEYAREGSAAHALAESCLNQGVSGHGPAMPKEYEKYDSFEMRTHVQGYLDYVRRHLGDGELFVEQRLQIFPKFDVWGTADAVIVTPDGVIKLVDLKYGKGLLVDAEDNTQLLLYGIGALTLDWLSKVPVHTVEVHIYQPRRNNVVSKTYSVEELAMWVKANEHKVARAHAGTDYALPGAHCKWCPVKGKCRERAEANLALASFDFAPGAECVSKDALTEEELVKVYLAAPLFRSWLEDIEAEVAKRAHEHEVTGLKWVAGKVTRRIVDAARAAKLLLAVGIEAWTKPEPKLLGITEIEKQLKIKGLKVVDVLADTVDRVAGNPVLVGADDKRDPINREQAAKEDFA